MARQQNKLNLNSPSLVDTAANTANVSTRVARWQPSPGVTFELGATQAEPRLRAQGAIRKGDFYPVIKLFTGAGAEAPGDTVISIAARPKNSRDETKLVSFDYAAFRDLSTAEQRNSDYKSSLLQSMRGVAGIGREGYLEVWVESSVVLDLSYAGTALEIPVAELTGQQ